MSRNANVPPPSNFANSSNDGSSISSVVDLSRPSPTAQTTPRIGNDPVLNSAIVAALMSAAVSDGFVRSRGTLVLDDDDELNVVGDEYTLNGE